jgi:hypothetical protein
MAEIRTVTRLKSKRDEIARAIVNYENKIAHAKVDLSSCQRGYPRRRRHSCPRVDIPSAQEIALRGRGDIADATGDFVSVAIDPQRHFAAVDRRAAKGHSITWLASDGKSIPSGLAGCG